MGSCLSIFHVCAAHQSMQVNGAIGMWHSVPAVIAPNGAAFIGKPAFAPAIIPEALKTYETQPGRLCHIPFFVYSGPNRSRMRSTESATGASPESTRSASALQGSTKASCMGRTCVRYWVMTLSTVLPRSAISR